MNEAVLTRLVIARLNAIDGVWAWRQNTGAAKTAHGVIRFGLPGSGDVTGLLVVGRRLEVELKSDVGRLTAVQRAFGARVTAMGGLYIASRTLDGVLTPVLEALQCKP